MRAPLLLAVVAVAACATAFTATVSFTGTSYSTPSPGVGVSPSAVVSADLNRDGFPDLAIAGDFAGKPIVAVLLATGPGKFGTETDYSVPADGFSDLTGVLAADFNGDGALDLIVNRTGVPQLDILWNNGDGTFRPGPTLKLGGPASFDLGDFNHDGLLDIATVECTSFAPPSCSMNVYLGKGKGVFTKLQSVHLANPAPQIRVADINGDGTPDVVVARTTQVLIFWGRGNGTFSAPTYLSPKDSNDIESFAIADFNNDGKLDIVADTGTNLSTFMGCLSGSSWFFKNLGGNSFSAALDVGVGGCSYLVPIDLNGDLNEDLIYQNGDPDAGFFVGVLGNGNGTFGQSFSGFPFFPNAPAASAQYVRDLDLDSRDDYVAGSQGFGNETVVALQTGGLKNCKPPGSAKLAAKICMPASGSKPTSPVLVRAAGNSPAGVIQLQVWIDGKKRAVKWHDQLAKKFILSPGTHRIAVVATDKYLGTAKAAVSVTVP